MTDIVQKLRRVDPNQALLAAPPHDTSYLQVGLLCHEAATEIERLRAERNAHSGSADAAWSMLSALRDALRRMDPAWCELHAEAQLDDEEFDQLLGTLEDLLEEAP